MKNLSDLLSRFKLSLDKDAEKRNFISGYIREKLGFDISSNNISIKNDSLIIKTTPAKRSEVKMHEKEILTMVRNSTGLNLKRILY
ncbi:MAG: hypothetical protein ACYCY6_01840 [Minisyncoccota bacterium]